MRKHRLIPSRSALLLLLLTFFGVVLSPHLSHADPAANLVKPLTDPRWRLQVLGQAKAGIARTDNGAVVTMLAPDGTDYHVELQYSGVSLTEGHNYTLRFRAKADTERLLPVYAVVSTGDFHGIGLDQAPMIGTQWRNFEYTFQAKDLSGQRLLCPQFLLGGTSGRIYLSDVLLTQAAPKTPVSSVKATPYWFLQHFDPAQALLRNEGNAQVVTISATDGESWHVQLGQMNAVVKDGVTYTVRFRAKADSVRDMMLMGGVSDTDYHPICDQQYVALGLSWQDYTFRITPHDSAGHSVGFPQFLLAKTKGTVWIDQVSVTSAEDGLADAPTDTAASSATLVLPSAGEIRVEGTVAAKGFSTRGFTLLAHRVIQPSGRVIILSSPRPKHIRLTVQTSYQEAGADSSRTSIKPGDRVSVIGDDAGVGKYLPARLVLK